MSKLEIILDKCLAQLDSGEVTIEDCLVQYPEHAAELRHLLTAADFLKQGQEVRPSPVFKARARNLLVAHLNAHPKTKASRWKAPAPFRLHPLVGRALNLAVAVLVILILVLSTGTVLAQTALPGEPLYDWKIASEVVLRSLHPNPLQADLMVAKRRMNDLAQVVDDPDALPVALQGYQQTLNQLSHYTEPKAQQTISEALREQKVYLEQADVVVPELNHILSQIHRSPIAGEPIDVRFSYQSTAGNFGTLTHRMIITNVSATNLITATLASSLSPNESLTEVNVDSCDLADGELICGIRNLPAGAAHEVTINTKVNPCYSGVITNTASVVSADQELSVEPSRQIVTESVIHTSFPRPISLIYAQSNYRTYDLGLVTSTADLVKPDLQPRGAAPAWSPDGKQLAFFGVEGVSELGGTFAKGNGVWIIDVIGDESRNPKQILSQDHVKSLAWSPDGTKLAVEIGPPDLPHEIFVVSADDGQEISRFPGEQPAWSPDSNRLIIKGCDPGCGLWLVDLEGRNGRQITSNGTDSYPAWSPTGEHLLFASLERDGNWEIYRLRWSDSQIDRLTQRPGTDTTPIFGPCGDELYLRTDQYGSWWITVMKLDGSQEYKVMEGVGPTDDWGLARPAVR